MEHDPTYGALAMLEALGLTDDEKIAVGQLVDSILAAVEGITEWPPNIRPLVIVAALAAVTATLHGQEQAGTLIRNALPPK